MSRSSPEPIELPGELPELDDDPDAADEPAIDHGELFVPLGDELDTDRDDETASDLDIGIDLSLALDGGAEPNEELVLDIGELLDDALERSLSEDDGNEPVDPEAFDPAVGLQPLPEHAPDTDDDAPWADADEVAGDLPDLDADETGEHGTEPNWVELDALAGSDHPLPDAPRRWHARLLPGVTGSCRDVALAHGHVLVGGAGLWRVSGSSAELLFSDDKSIESIAVTMGSVVVVNAVGTIRRLVLDAGENSASPVGPLDHGTTLRVASVQDGERVVALGDARTAFESADGGRSWQRLPLPGRVLALPRRADRLVALLETGGHRTLAVQEPGQALVERALEHGTELVASGDAPAIEALDRVVVLLDAGRGLLVSSDGGASFATVAGCAGAGAVCLGRFESQIRVWAALHSEWTGKTDIALIDPERATAERIAELSVGDSSDDGDSYVASALCWDADAGRLWIAGAHGLWLLEPEDADDAAPAL